MSKRWYTHAHTCPFLKEFSICWGPLNEQTHFMNSPNLFFCCSHHFLIWVHFVSCALSWSPLSWLAICWSPGLYSAESVFLEASPSHRCWRTEWVGAACWVSAPGEHGCSLIEGEKVTLSVQLMGRKNHGTFVIRSAGLQNVICMAQCVCAYVCVKTAP